MAHGWLRYGVAFVSLGCMTFVIARAASFGCASKDAGALPDAAPSAHGNVTPPEPGAQAAAVAEPSASSVAAPAASEAAASSSAATPLDSPGNEGDWGGITKSGRMITPQPQGARNPPPSQGK